MDIKSSNDNQESLVNEWYIFKNCSKFGPLTAKEIGALLDKNQISKDHHVWHQKYNNWVAIKDVDVFQAVGFELQKPKKEVSFVEDEVDAVVEAKAVVNKTDGGQGFFKKLLGLFK